MRNGGSELRLLVAKEETGVLCMWDSYEMVQARRILLGRHERTFVGVRKEALQKDLQGSLERDVLQASVG